MYKKCVRKNFQHTFLFMSRDNPKQILFNIEAREKLKKGIDMLANAVKVTLGPKGRNVIITRGPDSNITKDGVSVAKEVFLKDPVENTGAQILKEIAKKTADQAGDGTTTATVLGQSIFTAGLKNITAGANPMDLKKGIDIAVKIVINELKNMSKEIGIEDSEKVKQIATISSNNDSFIGELISTSVSKVKKDGVITVEESNGIETTVEIVDGMKFARGYVSPYFVTDTDKMEAVLENPLILICDKKISVMKEVLPIMEKALKTGNPILIISDDLDGDALAAIVLNRVRANFKICAIKGPYFGDRRKSMLEDIAVLTGGVVISNEQGRKLEEVELTDLGRADRIIIDRDHTTIIGGLGSKESINSRANQIKSQIEKATNEYEVKGFNERLAKLVGGVAVIYVGATTELEMKEKKDRVDDAVAATMAAIDEGIIPGGGVAYIRASKKLENIVGENQDETIGIQIIRKALEEPLRQICYNAGIESSVVINNVLASDDFGYGFNARTEKYENLFDSGVIDPTKVARVALENAASVASLLLTTECVLVEEPDDKTQMIIERPMRDK